REPHPRSLLAALPISQLDRLPRITGMLVRSRMTREVITASPTMTVAAAVALTREHRIRHLPVVEDGRLVGVASDRDLRLAIPPRSEEHTSELQSRENL